MIADPQHGGGHVANRRPSPAGVGGDDHDTGEEPALLLVINQLAQQRDHHDGGGQVVQYRREKEGNKTDQPQQRYPFAGADALGNDLEAVVGIDQFDNGHGANQKEQNFGNFAQVLTQFAIDPMGRAGKLWRYVFEAQHQYRPAQHRCENRRRRFVDLERVLKGDAQITEDENNRHQCIHS